MRAAKAADYRRAAQKRTYNVRLETFRFIDVLGLGRGEISFGPGVTVIAGGNGSGKTSMLNAMVEALRGKAIHTPEIAQRRLKNARIEAIVTTPAGSTTVYRDASAAATSSLALNLPVFAYTPAEESRKAIEFFSTTQNLDELLAAHEPRILSETEVDELSYLIGRDYDKCSVYELDEFSEVEPLPYFVVKSGTMNYGSEFMGVGELALHHIVWRLASLPQDCILLLEEPEAALAPRSQIALLDILAKVATEKGAHCIITSHSPHIIYGVPTANIRLLVRTGEGIEVRPGPTISELDNLLGWPPETAIIAICEDVVAREIVRATLHILAPDLDYVTIVREVGDASTVRALLRKFPSIRPQIAIIGILDGDQRNVAESVTPHGLVYLPGDHAPEQFLIDAARKDPEAVSSQLKIGIDQFKAVVSELMGADPHDWIAEVAKRSRVSVEGVVAALTFAWCRTDPEASELLAKNFRALAETLRGRERGN